MLSLKRKNDIHIFIPTQPLKVMEALNRAGFEAYIVGGCVRDSLMKKMPHDWDITTNLSADRVKQLFQKSFETGKQHGTITVLSDGMPIEVTTYRIDGEYKDFRRPEQVIFTSSLKEDLSRRDFTVNAMAYHPEVGLVDLFGGLKDIKDRILRTVGDADQRFSEDALRILRCVRFAHCLGFDVEPNTYESIIRNAPLLQNIAYERIREEMNQMLLSDGNLLLLQQTGIFAQVLPELAECFAILQDNQTVGMHMLKVASLIRKDIALRWAALLHEVGKNNSQQYQKALTALNRFKFDNKTRNIILCLIQYHNMNIELSPMAVKIGIKTVGKDRFPLLLELKKADILAEPCTDELDYLHQLEQLYQQVKHDPIQPSDLAVTGSDIKGLGYEGKEIGVILNKLVDYVMENPQENNKQALLNKASEIRRNYEKNRNI